MISALGKIGMGLAGIIAFAGLMSVGVQQAGAEIILASGTPIETVGSVSGTYDFTYDLVFGGPDVTLMSAGTNRAYVSLSMGSSNTADLYSVPVLTVTDTGIGAAGGSFGEAGGTPTYPSPATTGAYAFAWFYNGGSYTSLSQNETIGYITVVSNTANAVRPSGVNFTTQAAQNVSANLPGGQAAITHGYVDVPNINGTPLALPAGSPLPLPSAFWPGLLTIGGMAVVGGLRLRRRTV